MNFGSGCAVTAGRPARDSFESPACHTGPAARSRSTPSRLRAGRDSVRVGRPSLLHHRHDEIMVEAEPVVARLVVDDEGVLDAKHGIGIEIGVVVGEKLRHQRLVPLAPRA